MLVLPGSGWTLAAVCVGAGKLACKLLLPPSNSPMVAMEIGPWDARMSG